MSTEIHKFHTSIFKITNFPKLLIVELRIFQLMHPLEQGIPLNNKKNIFRSATTSERKQSLKELHLRDEKLISQQLHSIFTKPYLHLIPPMKHFPYFVSS